MEFLIVHNISVMLLSLVLSPHFSLLLGWLTPRSATALLSFLSFAVVSGHVKQLRRVSYLILEQK